MQDRTQQTVFHITHPKTGSQWAAEILKYCALDRFIQPQDRSAHFFKEPISQGSIYPSVYASRVEFEAILGVGYNLRSLKYMLQCPMIITRNFFTFRVRKRPFIKFVVIRDLRDTLVSAYFSFRISHPALAKNLGILRKVLKTLDKEQGMIFLLNEALPTWANRQLSWLNAPKTLLIKYEDLLADEHRTFKKIIDYCRIDVDQGRLHEIVSYNSFETITGRKRGQEDVLSHQRKGIAGDWLNHFSERVKEEFKARFGEVLIKTGYESNLNW